ncbi:MAG: DEAD/DEAH box helicase family protein [Lachnospiraceae bacterium]|nr:DEAD/DEAH box helicase family protein [Lachnospiraceae bacterium]
MKNMKDLQFGLETAFIDYRAHSNLACRPEFVSNDFNRGKRVISSIEQELLNCDEFSISVAFVKNIKTLLAENETRALLISAMGTGKTYASAFALREMNPKKVLFLVHRERIAKQAL